MRLTQVEVEFAVMKTDFEKEKIAFGDAVGVAVAQCQNKIDSVINDARAEFAKVREENMQAHVTVVEQTRNALAELQQKIMELEGMGPGHGGGGGKFKGYLPLEKSLPEKLGDKVEEWRAWKKNVAGYLDTITPGIRAYWRRWQRKKKLQMKIG